MNVPIRTSAFFPLKFSNGRPVQGASSFTRTRAASLRRFAKKFAPSRACRIRLSDSTMPILRRYRCLVKRVEMDSGISIGLDWVACLTLIDSGIAANFYPYLLVQMVSLILSEDYSSNSEKKEKVCRCEFSNSF